jgi:hypothetical protein
MGTRELSVACGVNPRCAALATAIGAFALAGCLELDGVEGAPSNPVAESELAGEASIGAPAAGDGPDDNAEPGDCAGAAVASWVGSASRVNERYPDDVYAEITWHLLESTGCRDRYEASGVAQYSYAIPGALCRQSIDPDATELGTDDGALIIDRSATPPTFEADGATRWSVTWTCTDDDGRSETETFDGGGAWIDGSGTVEDERIAGEHVIEEGRCGRGHSGLPCTFAWSFEPSSL